MRSKPADITRVYPSTLAAAQPRSVGNRKIPPCSETETQCIAKGRCCLHANASSSPWSEFSRRAICTYSCLWQAFTNAPSILGVSSAFRTLSTEECWSTGGRSIGSAGSMSSTDARNTASTGSMSSTEPRGQAVPVVSNREALEYRQYP